MRQPLNYSKIDEQIERIISDAKYALQVAESFIDCLPHGVNSLIDKTILDIGPGNNLGEVLILRCLGAKEVFVADRFLCRFQKDYHCQLYENILGLIQNKYPSADFSSLINCINNHNHEESGIICTEAPLEELAVQFPSIFDLTFSNAVFEHLYDPFEAFKSLYKMMAPGSLGFHQVDFRDHRNFTYPLEYLLYDEFSFNKIMVSEHAECGNRMRPHQMQELLILSGFNNVEFNANLLVDFGYLQGFLPRLRRSLASPYHSMDIGYLQEIGGRFTITK